MLLLSTFVKVVVLSKLAFCQSWLFTNPRKKFLVAKLPPNPRKKLLVMTFGNVTFGNVTFGNVTFGNDIWEMKNPVKECSKEET